MNDHGFPTPELMSDFEAPGYRFGLAFYGALGFVLSTLLSTKYDPEIYKLVILAGKNWKSSQPNNPWGYNVLWIAIPLFVFVFEAPNIGKKILAGIITNSMSYGLYLALVYFCLASISFIDFGLNGGLAIQFIGFGFILASTEFLKGFEFDFAFSNNRAILREARIEKIKFLHKKWFSAISALVTVAMAICITAAIKLFETSRDDLGRQAAELLAQMLGSLVVYAGAGLMLGPFTQMFKILARIEDQMDHIEAEEHDVNLRTKIK